MGKIDKPLLAFDAILKIAEIEAKNIAWQALATFIKNELKNRV